MYCVHPKATFPLRLGIVDYFGLTFLATHLISDTLVEGWSWVFLLRAYTEWACPYIAGRLAFQKWSDVEKLVPYGVAVTTILGIDSAIEALMNVHVFEWIHGLRPYENFERNAKRWGLFRSWGTRSHSIYFGNIQLMLIIWPSFALYKAIRKEWSHLMIIPIIVCCLGIFFTISRGPMLGVVLFVSIALFLLVPRSRIPVAAATVTLVIATFLFWPTVRDILVRTGRIDSGRIQGPLIKEDGKYVEFSGTMTRWHELKLYLPSAIRGGLFGYGSTATQDFPPRVGIRTEDVQALKRWKFVDNSYLLIMLRFGWIGLICFCGMGISAAVRLAARGNSRTEGVSLMSLLTCSALCSILVVISTVWLAPDFQFLLFFLFGIGSTPIIMETQLSRDQNH
jgi:hypothetical protein